MAFINNEEINNIRAQTNIVDIISSYINVVKKGKDYKCVCPFHDDHSPSMSISEDKQIYKCFSCGEAGNVFTFVSKYENVSFIESVKIVADKIGYHLKGDYTKVVNTKFSKEKELMALVNKFYENNLNTINGRAAKEYLAKRKIDDKIIKEFNIGLSLDNNDDLYQLLTKKGYDIKLLDDLGLINKVGDSVYDTFRGRIMFPINDSEGNIIAYSSRIYRGEDLAKYINTKETYLYTKGNTLFNYFRAKKYAKKEGSIILVEGQMDAIRIYSSNIFNVVALNGTALTKEQIELLKALRCKVILCLDSDEAGKNATLVNGDLLEKNNIVVQVIRLADYKDPDEYILNKGIEAFKENLSKPMDFLDFKINALKDNVNIDNSEELATYINQVIDDIANIKDDILKEVTLNKISEEYHISIDILKNKLNSKKQVDALAKEIFVPKKNKIKLDSLNIAIRKILFYMMNDIKYIKIYQHKIGYFEDPKYRLLANEIVYYADSNKEIKIADFISYINSNEELNELVLDIVDNQDEELRDDVFSDYIELLNKKSIDLKIKRLKLDLKKEEDVHKKLEIAKQIEEIKKGSVIINEED